MPSFAWLQPVCKVSPLVRSIFFGRNADLESEPHCKNFLEQSIVVTVTE